VTISNEQRVAIRCETTQLWKKCAGFAWSKRTVAGLLPMPPTRHNFLHLNEALRIKQKLTNLWIHE
jgi:hypothetical protein